jgi:hypothetical protein
MELICFHQQSWKCKQAAPIITFPCIMYNAVFIIMENEKSSSFTPLKSPLTENAGNKAGAFQEAATIGGIRGSGQPIAGRVPRPHGYKV